MGGRQVALFYKADAMQTGTTVIRNCNIAERDRRGTFDIAVADGRIVRVAESIEPAAGDRTIDACGMTATCGLVDVHVHLREPGYGYKERIATGTAAAARGGYTTVCAMPNLDPVPDTPEHLQRQLDIIAADAVVKVLPYCSITLGRMGVETVDFAALKEHAAAFSDDGSGVQSDDTMLRAMRLAAEKDVLIAAHCEVDELLRGGYIHDGAYAARNGHKGICSESEWRQIERDVRLAEQTGCRYHVCHISTAQSVDIIRRAKARGVAVTCETAPHYLVFCDEDLQDEGCWKMNPPLRSAADREALLKGIADGTIDMIATDHAPHSEEEKSRGLQGSAMGIVGLETAFGVLYTHLVESGRITLDSLLELMSGNPRRIFRIGGALREGERADITLLDLRTEYEIDPSTFLSLGRSTPFAGMRVRGRAAMTMVDGRVVYMDETINKR